MNMKAPPKHATVTPESRITNQRIRIQGRASRSRRIPASCAPRLASGTAAALLTVSLCVLTSCEYNPFYPTDRDHGKRVDTAKLREVERVDFSQYMKPASDGGKGQDSEAGVREAAGRFAGVDKIEISIDECRASALSHNLELKVAFIEPAIAAQSVTREEARFESAFTLRAGWRDLDSPTSSALSSAQSNAQTIEPGVRIPLLTGGTASVSLPVARSETDNSFSTLNPAYTSDLEFSISQPLLRNAGRRAATAALRIAGYNRQASEAQTKLEVIRQIAAADRAYWRLYQARRELEVRQEQYDLAVEQQGRADRRVRAQVAPEIEMVRAQAAVADSLESIIVAQNALLDRQRELKRIINMPGLTIDTMVMVVPSTPPDPVQYEFDRQELIGRAVENRMEMLELELRLAADAATIAFNKNQSLPLFTLDYTYRINGLGASTQDSFRTLQRNRFEDWELGLSAEIPLGNELAKSRIREAILRRLARLATRESRELSIREEVLSAIDAIDAAWQRILASRQSVILNTRTYQAEQRQFEVGRSTGTDVRDQLIRLAQAKSAEARALADYQIAQVDLAFATGTLLGADKIRWDPAPTPDACQPAPRETLIDRRGHGRAD